MNVFVHSGVLNTLYLYVDSSLHICVDKMESESLADRGRGTTQT